MAAALTIAAKDLRQRFRDRSAIVLGFVAPMLIAVLMSFAFRGTEHFHITIGVVNDDSGQVATGFVDALEGPELKDVLTATQFDSRTAVERAVNDRDVDVGLVIPAGFSDATTTNRPENIVVLSSVDSPLSGQVARSIVESFVAQVNAVRLSVSTALAAGAPASEIDTLVQSAGQLEAPVQVQSAPTGSRPLKAISYYAPAMAIFFLFFAVSFTARGWFLEQREGTLERMTAAVRPQSVLLGKALAVFVYGTACLATMAIFTSVVFGADWGGPVPAGALCLAMVAAVVAITALVITLAKTERQVEAIASMVIFGLALLGGNFTFISSSPEAMRRLALLTPNGWALRGFVDLATGSHSLATVTQPLLGITLFTIVVAVLAGLLARRRLTT